MEQERYMRRLARTARWRLPEKEAAEVIADYRELLADGGGESLGDPVRAVRLLERPGAYRRWMAAFVLLAALALAGPLSGLYNLPFEAGIWGEIPVLRGLWRVFSRNDWLFAALALLGMAASWVRFRRSGVRAEKRVGWGTLLPLLLPELLVLAGAWGVFCLVSAGPETVSAFLAGRGAWAVKALRLFLELGGPLCGGLGVWGLVRARTEERRWLALYLLGLAAGGMCVSVLALLSSLSLDFSAAGWWRPYARLYSGLTAAGLLGAGWALC